MTHEPLPPLGATVRDGLTTFRVWATATRTSVAARLLLPGGVRLLNLARDPAAPGLWSLSTHDAPHGTRYTFRLDGGPDYPDPCSRWQPDGVHGPSAVVDPAAFRWRDGNWPGIVMRGAVIYELHTGAFTPAGTFDAAIDRLDGLRDLGVTAIEIMPAAEFPGTRNWGYDGVDLYAPSHVYGGPNGLRRLVDAAHARGLSVLLDVVYNHLGPDGNYLRAFSPAYFTDRWRTPWGDALNFDGPSSGPVREYVLQNAEQWVRDYHIDGLRLDATHAIYDASRPHLLQALQQRARAAAGGRTVVIIAENDANDVRLIALVRDGGDGLDGVWADDFHHAVHTALTGEREGYYEDYDGNAAAVARALREGFIYQGQPSRHSGQPRGTRIHGEPAERFVFCLQNHDQIGNRALGERLSALVSPGAVRAATALLLLAPETPLLFMGEEFAASSPFLYFADHEPDLGRLVTEGRRAEFGAFAAFKDAALRERIPDPQAEATFQRSKLDWAEAERHGGMLRLHRHLLALRRHDAVFRDAGRLETEAAPCGPRAVAMLRRTGDVFRLLLANLGEETVLDLAAPFLAALRDTRLRLLLRTDDAAYRLPGEPAPTGGEMAAPDTLDGLWLPARTAFVFVNGRVEPARTPGWQ